jgi:hypothetical protein
MADHPGAGRSPSRRVIRDCSRSATLGPDPTKRVAAAVGEGSAAVRSVHEHLAFEHEDG